MRCTFNSYILLDLKAYVNILATLQTEVDAFRQSLCSILRYANDAGLPHSKPIKCTFQQLQNAPFGKVVCAL